MSSLKPVMNLGQMLETGSREQVLRNPAHPCTRRLLLAAPIPDPTRKRLPVLPRVIVTGNFTDQCISSSVRSLADESFNVVVVEDCCAAATDALHRHELEVINMINCHVASAEEVKGFLVR